MLRLTYSNQTERLLEALVETLEGERARSSPLEPAHLVVPNASVETWLRLGLARATGIAANLEVRFLRRFVAELVARAQPEVRLLDAFRLEALLLALFHDDAFLAEPELGEVRRYLQGGGGGSG
ncbi:MAG: exodeoxyribonuclease V subunit gamma, partial [Gemmatimonadales bacterium]